jgi:hypothetical protein
MTGAQIERLGLIQAALIVGDFTVIEILPAGCEPNEHHAPKISAYDRVLVAININGKVKKISIPEKDPFFRYVEHHAIKFRNLRGLNRDGTDYIIIQNEPKVDVYDELAMYKRTSGELCEKCNWRFVVPGIGCLNCSRKLSVEPPLKDSGGRLS